MTESRKNILSGTVIVMVSLVYLILSFSIKLTKFCSVDSAVFPRFISAVLLLLGLVLLIEGFRQNRQDTTANIRTPEQRAAQKKGLRKILSTLLILGGTILTMHFLGFITASLLFLISFFATLSVKEMNVRTWILYTVIAAIATAVIYVSFEWGFGLMLPSGVLFDFL